MAAFGGLIGRWMMSVRNRNPAWSSVLDCHDCVAVRRPLDEGVLNHGVGQVVRTIERHVRGPSVGTGLKSACTQGGRSARTWQRSS